MLATVERFEEPHAAPALDLEYTSRFHDIVIMLNGSDRFTAIINFRRCMMRPTFYEWMNSDRDIKYIRTDAKAIRKDMLEANPEKKRFMVFEGDASEYLQDLITYGNDHGLRDEEYTFDNLLRTSTGISLSRKNIRYNVNSTLTACSNQLTNYIEDVNAVVGYVKKGRGQIQLFVKDAEWTTIAFPLGNSSSHQELL